MAMLLCTDATLMRGDDARRIHLCDMFSSWLSIPGLTQALLLVQSQIKARSIG